MPINFCRITMNLNYFTSFGYIEETLTIDDCRRWFHRQAVCCFLICHRAARSLAILRFNNMIDDTSTHDEELIDKDFNLE